MKSVVKHIFNKRTILIFLIGLAFVLSIVSLRIYFSNLDKTVSELLNKKEVVYETKNNEVNNRGFYVANLEEELNDLISKKDVTTLTYEFENESFYFDIRVLYDEEGNPSFEIEKIGCPEYQINARMNMRDVESIEYRTGNPDKSTVLKINQKYNTNYFAMTLKTYYFLGNDIESISYKDDHFYYITYNPNYKSLEEADSCSKAVISKIDGFSTKHYYYKYGKINFLSDYYQKLASKTFTVKNKCDELSEKVKDSES